MMFQVSFMGSMRPSRSNRVGQKDMALISGLVHGP